MTAVATAPEAPLNYQAPRAIMVREPLIAPTMVAMPEVRGSSTMQAADPPTPTPEARQRRNARIKTEVLRETPYVLAGERFLATMGKRGVIIQHPRWSLIGSGKTLAAAERDLFANAGIVMRVYGRKPASSLDYEARKMYHFALRIAYE